VRHSFLCIALTVLSLVACGGARRAHAQHERAAAAKNAGLLPAELPSVERRTPRIRVERVAIGAHGDAFVLRGGRGAERIAFLHGQCSSAHGYLDSFEFTAAARGAAVAPDGDRGCSDGRRRTWSRDLDGIDALIASSFALAAGERDQQRVTLVGYSLGATRAEQIARRHPQRYDALVLIGAPNAPSPRGLEHLRGAAMLAGERDRQSLMRRGVKAFRAAGIPAEFFVLPRAAHGQMGPDAERVMSDVFDWLDAL
jgi:pimeloyl-ACP methyl ester carboxylesterase